MNSDDAVAEFSQLHSLPIPGILLALVLTVYYPLSTAHIEYNFGVSHCTNYALVFAMCLYTTNRACEDLCLMQHVP